MKQQMKTTKYNYRIKDENGMIKFVGVEASKFGLGSWFNLEQARELRMDGDSIYEFDKDGNELWETL